MTTTTANQTTAQNLATAAGKFSALGGSHPDFVPFASLSVQHAHFTPPGIYASGSAPEPANGDGTKHTEVGGDVGGVVVPYSVDGDYLLDTGVAFVGTISGSHGVPTSSRRQ